LREHSTAQSDALEWIQRQTNMHTNFPQMLSGQIQGNLLRMIVQMTGAKRIVEIGTFTGYSAVCLASGMPEGGHLDALEKNDEMEYIIREGFERAGVDDRITLRIGDAKETLKSLDGPFDLVFMDADKREYCEYFDLVFDKLVPGGLIIADDVLWDGKVYADPLPQDRQTVGIMAFNDMIKSHPGVENVILPLRDGINLIRKSL
jgi:predicted O-methyltransferase YrrM